MVESRSTIPEFTVTSEVEMTNALEVREQLNSLRTDDRVSVNDLVVKAVALGLREFPNINASYEDDVVVHHGRVDIGIAVDAGDALLVPVIAGADEMQIHEIAAATRAAAERARRRTLTAEELSAGTFTVSNLGMFNVTSFSAIINPPQVAILAVGAVAKRPWIDDQSRVVVSHVMQLSLSCDHRVVYGAEAARFLARVRELLEAPVSLVAPRPSSERGAT
jgi:pyruvate dehydrogenase E2 component (dihydrolipoamide acetyltransferase)